MLIELSKREIEVILELMELGITYTITHGDPQFSICKVSDGKEIPNKHKKAEKIINTNDLKDKLKGYLKCNENCDDCEYF